MALVSSKANKPSSLSTILLVIALSSIPTWAQEDSPQDYLNAHNAARSAVGVGPVTWDADVAAYAQSYARQRAGGDCSLVHSGGPYGENLAWSSGQLSGADAVGMWVNEKADYNYNANTCAEGKVCGHYTQVVWGSTARIGCAKAACSGGRGTFVICNYNPPGNFIFRKPYSAASGSKNPDNVKNSTEGAIVNENKSRKRVVIWAAIAGSIGIGILVILFAMISRRNSRRKASANMAEIAKNKYGIWGGDEQNNTQLTFFTFKDVMAATDNFSESNKLGEGGFGPVYKGKLSDDQQVAMKRLSKKSGQGLEEFMNELKLIAKLQHTYLVRLLGCCVERDEKILIYEYMPNRSLDKFLFGSCDEAKLDWGQRVKIAEGIAQGLLYIHKYSRLKIIHRDMKASNVLLDAAMNPKISDFGMARIFGIDQDEANTNRIVGTYGYMSPEYAFYGQFSEKSDVFSFGVLLLEIVSGKRNKDFYHRENPSSLLCWVWELWKEGNPEEVIDPAVKNNGSLCDPMEAVKLIHVGLLCVQEAPADRPTMSAVTRMLSSNDSQSFLSPGEPAFVARRAAAAAETNDQVGVNCSNNQITVSLPSGR